MATIIDLIRPTRLARFSGERTGGTVSASKQQRTLPKISCRGAPRRTYSHYGRSKRDLATIASNGQPPIICASAQEPRWDVLTTDPSDVDRIAVQQTSGELSRYLWWIG